MASEVPGVDVTVEGEKVKAQKQEAVDFPDLFSTPAKKGDGRPSMPLDTPPVPPASQEKSPPGTQTSDKDKKQEEAINNPLPKLNASLRETVIPGESNRTDFALLPSKTALLIIDVQEYLSTPSTPKEEEENSYFYKTSLPRAVQNLQKLVSTVREKRDSQVQGCEVIFTYLEALTKDCRDISLDYKLSGPKLATLPNSTTARAKFLSDLIPRPKDGKGDILLPKTSCSVFASTNLHYLLQNLCIEQLVITGQLTDQCVESAVRDAADLGYFVTLVEDACAANSQEAHEKGLFGIKGFCRSVSTEQVIAELVNPEQVVLAIPPATPKAAADEKLPTSQRQAAEAMDAQFAILPTEAFYPPSTDETVINSIMVALKFAGIKFVRFMTMDAYNSSRCKSIPIKCFQANDTVSIATVCIAGLPSFADTMLEGTGLDAKGVLEVKPNFGTLRILPYASKTALLFGTLHEVPSRELSVLCTRGLLSRLVETAKSLHGITFNVGLELEFCLHDAKTGEPLDQSIFANSTTLNQREDFIVELHDQLEQQEIDIELVHGESAPGQLEIVLKYITADPVRLADNAVLARETIQAVAHGFGYKALFLPKIHEDKAGNGMHVHLSFGSAHNSNIFPGATPNSMSREGQSFLEGILCHLPGLLGVTLPSTNSFRRVGPGCWTGHHVGWAVEDKEVPLRVCCDSKSKQLTNVEFKLSDATGNLYLMLACILSCGLDGIVHQLELRPSSTSSSASAVLPTSFNKALDCLQADEFLMQVMGPKLSRAYLAVRRTEAARAAKQSLSDEVDEALTKS